MRTFGIVVLAAVAPALGEVIALEGLSFPETEGWVRNPFCTPERSLENGLFWQAVEIGECGPPPGGDSDSYRWELADFIGADRFFIEFRMMTSGDESEFIGQAPAVMSAASFGAVTYRWTIARDKVKLFRDALLPVLFFDIESEVMHTYRLELDGLEYAWLVDGVVVDSGEGEGAYPSFQPFLIFRAGVYEQDSVTGWDYVRFGVIPTDASGDFDSDGHIDLRDWRYFLECVARSGNVPNDPEWPGDPGCRWADMDFDSDVDMRDFGHFQRLFGN